MKRRITVILTALILALMLASCGSNGQEGSGDPAGEKTNGNKTLHTLYFKDITQREDVRAVFYNSNTKETADVKMTASGEDSDGFVYTCEGDASAYNMVSFSYFISIYLKLKNITVLALGRPQERPRPESMRAVFAVGVPAAVSLLWR